MGVSSSDPFGRRNAGVHWLEGNGPGLVLVLAIAVVARVIAGYLPPALGDAIVAVLLGLLIRNAVGIPRVFQAGVRFTLHNVLRLAIVLLGIRLSFVDAVRIGAGSLAIILVCIAVALVLTYYAARLVKLPPRLAILIGVGTAVCGNSAIVATAPVIEARDEDVSFAVATITLFGTLAVLTYPLVGHLLRLSDVAFGTWAGTAVSDTSQVVAAGFAYSDAAGQVATVVKLTRNTLMAPLIVLMGYVYARTSQRRPSARAATSSRFSLSKMFPWFVLGFFGMAVLNTLSVFPKSVSQEVYDLSRFLVLMALAGVGAGTSLVAMRRAGLRPFFLGLLTALVVALLSFTLVTALIH